METKKFLRLAGGKARAADLLGIPVKSFIHWSVDVPMTRVLQLKKLRPEWFVTSPKAKP